jgi:hypothetical protein
MLHIVSGISEPAFFEKNFNKRRKTKPGKNCKKSATTTTLLILISTLWLLL